MILAYSGLLYVSLLFLEGSTTLKFRGFLYVFTPWFLLPHSSVDHSLQPCLYSLYRFLFSLLVLWILCLSFLHMSYSLMCNLIVSTKRCLERKLVKVPLTSATWSLTEQDGPAESERELPLQSDQCSALGSAAALIFKCPFIRSPLGAWAV